MIASSKIGILRIGNSNIVGVSKIVRESGADVKVVQSSSDLKGLTHLIIPGVGSFDYGMRSIRGLGLENALLEWVGARKPVLGICLGMHLLGTSSSEGAESGLNIIPGHFSLLNSEVPVKVPHLGWNEVNPLGNSPLFNNIEYPRFYFNHSYGLTSPSGPAVIATSYYGKDFAAAYSFGNTYGVQFHPEKSHKAGRTLINNFITL
jgi:glutamine amidotransferase